MRFPRCAYLNQGTGFEQWNMRNHSVSRFIWIEVEMKHLVERCHAFVSFYVRPLRGNATIFARISPWELGKEIRGESYHRHQTSVFVFSGTKCNQTHHASRIEIAQLYSAPAKYRLIIFYLTVNLQRIQKLHVHPLRYWNSLSYLYVVNKNKIKLEEDNNNDNCLLDSPL